MAERAVPGSIPGRNRRQIDDVRQVFVKLFAGNRMCSKRREMRCFLLAIDQLDAIFPEKGNQMGQSDFGCVADTANIDSPKNIFPRQIPIRAPHQLLVVP